MERKFRAKRIDNGEWVYGDFMRRPSGAFITYICEAGFFQHFVDEKTVGQLTPLTDRLGNQIYEGDLLDFDETEWGGKFTPEVVTMEKLIGGWGLAGSKEDLKSWRAVIGNIYQ